MRERIKDFLEKMGGMQRIIFETLCVIILVDLVYAVTYWISGDMEITNITTAIVVAIVAIVAVVVTFTNFVASVAAVFAAVVIAVIIENLTVATVGTIVALIVAVGISKEYDIKYYKVPLIYTVEVVVFYFSFIIPVVALCTSLLGTICVVSIISLKALKICLEKNPPPKKPCGSKEFGEVYGCREDSPYRKPLSIKNIPPPLEPFGTRIYRFAYKKLN